MATKEKLYVMPNRAFYRLGVYSPPGTPFTIAEGTRPPSDAFEIDGDGYKVKYVIDPELKAPSDQFSMSNKPGPIKAADRK